jgi:hypothetical protein
MAAIGQTRRAGGLSAQREVAGFVADPTRAPFRPQLTWLKRADPGLSDFAGWH